MVRGTLNEIFQNKNAVMFITALIFMTGILSYFNDNAIYSCYKERTVNLPAVNGWHNILVSRMSNNPQYLTQLDMTQIGDIFFRTKGDGIPWTSWYYVFNHNS